MTHDLERWPRVVEPVDDAVPAVIATVDVSKSIRINMDVSMSASRRNGLGKA